MVRAPQAHVVRRDVLAPALLPVHDGKRGSTVPPSVRKESMARMWTHRLSHVVEHEHAITRRENCPR